MLDTILQALNDANRRRILDVIGTRECPAGDIAAAFDISQPAVSQHLKVLVDAGLLTVRREGTRRLYRINYSGFDELKDYLTQFWDGQLSALKFAAEAEEKRHQQS